MQIISIILSLILILTIIFHRTLHTIPNLLTANSSLAIFIYAFVVIIQIIVGLQSKDKGKEDLFTAISQYFFNILYRRKYLLTFRIHWLIIIISWCISCFLPLFLYLSGALQYSSEMHMCTLKMSVQWALFIYMGAALGIPFFGIVGIYLYITRHIRRINTMTIAITTSLSTAKRDLHVLKNILTLIGILGTAGLPNIILVIWNAFSLDEAPVSLYLICVLTISFCTNIQISFIFVMNKNVKVVFFESCTTYITLIY
ncbi:unnamed protein product [Rotaria sordida]|uniref:G-protein coupled receptors family 1 profile domain-containing protein n=1 Tax=Rotaria sordida TaxID=392033 RepID=A0A814MJA3_9BILA|nr:unnamed protein product [Rotaria sordida]CAF3673865.1 unnamed protein product [Rotaria sordida]